MKLKTLLGLAAAASLAGAIAPLSAQAESWPVVRVATDSNHDLSPPLSELAASEPRATGRHEHKIDRVKPIPRPHVVPGPDGALQSAEMKGPALATSDVIDFAGIGQGDYGFSPDAAPPDTNGVVGATQYVQFVNESIAVFNKADGALLMGPVKGHVIWKGLAGDCSKQDDGDPIVQYDKLAKRWIVTQFFVSGKKYLECVAVSRNSNATGQYYRYAFSYGAHDFNDYPKIGVWPDGWYVTYNIFTDGQAFKGAMACAFDRVRMLKGGAGKQQCVQLSSQYGGLLPADLDGRTKPPLHAPNYLVTYDTNKLQLFKFFVDWRTPANTHLDGPTNIPVPSFTPACGGNGGACVPQKGVPQLLDTLADRPMYRLAYRNFGDHESLVLNQSVTVGKAVGVRWYELRDPGGTPVAYQASTYAPDRTFRWMGSAAQDRYGNLAVGYSHSSTRDFPGMRYAVRSARGALNVLGPEQIILDGGGSQYSSSRALDRWGDYSALTVDPVDDCTFWFTSEYLKTQGIFNWSTRIHAFRTANCKTTTEPEPAEDDGE
jgi:hypothetical protein